MKKNTRSTILFAFLIASYCCRAQSLSDFSKTQTVETAAYEGITAQFNLLTGIAIDRSGNVYLAEPNNHKIQKISPAGLVSTLAGTGFEGDVDGASNRAQFNNPIGVATDDFGNVYVADAGNQKIKKITADGMVHTLLTNEIDNSAEITQFNSKMGIAVDAAGTVYVADLDSHKIRKITASGVLSNWADNQEKANSSLNADDSLKKPIGATMDALGNIYIGNYSNFIKNKKKTEPVQTTTFDWSSNTTAYPNPSTGIFTVQTNDAAVLNIFNASGQKAFYKKIAAGASQIDLSPYSAGIYLLTVTGSSNRLEVLKLVKK